MSEGDGNRASIAMAFGSMGFIVGALVGILIGVVYDRIPMPPFMNMRTISSLAGGAAVFLAAVLYTPLCELRKHKYRLHILSGLILLALTSALAAFLGG